MEDGGSQGTYQISIENQYFEDMDSVLFGSYKSEQLLIGATWTIENLLQGNYNMAAYTHSGLIMRATTYLVGTKSNVSLVITEKGKIILKE
jgi:hypothetical protein